MNNPKFQQPTSFKFTKKALNTAKEHIAKYPKGRQASAVMPLLDLAQRQHDNWLPMKAIEEIATRLDMAEIRVLEVASFYTMYNLKPVGKFFLQACTTTPLNCPATSQQSRADLQIVNSADNDKTSRNLNRVARVFNSLSLATNLKKLGKSG